MQCLKVIETMDRIQKKNGLWNSNKPPVNSGGIFNKSIITEGISSINYQPIRCWQSKIENYPLIIQYKFDSILMKNITSKAEPQLLVSFTVSPCQVWICSSPSFGTFRCSAFVVSKNPEPGMNIPKITRVIDRNSPSQFQSASPQNAGHFGASKKGCLNSPMAFPAVLEATLIYSFLHFSREIRYHHVAAMSI